MADNAELLKRLAAAEAEIAAYKEALRPTTLLECLEAYHQYIPPPSVRPNSESTKGGTVPPKGRKMPTLIRAWESFPDEQRQAMEKLFQIVPDADQKFHSRHSIETLGQDLEKKRLSSELDLSRYSDQALETPVASIFRTLQQDYADVAKAHGIELGTAIEFENHLNTLSEHHSSRKRPPVDSACNVSLGPDMSLKQPMFSIEYKAAHKLTAVQLEAGLKDIDLTDVMNRVRIPAKDETDACLIHQSEVLVAAVLTQIFDYTVQLGLCFGYVWTGLHYIFLKIDYDHPNILYYHLADPATQAATQLPARALCTPIGQLLSFCLMAVQGEVLDFDAHEQIYDNLPTWEVDLKVVAEALSSSPPSPTEMISPPGSATKASKKMRDIDSIPPSTRQTRSRCNTPSSCRPRSPNRTPSPEAEDRNLQRTRKQPANTSGPTASKVSHRRRREPRRDQTKDFSFCSHKCLQSLFEESRPDPSCPNFSRHFSLNDVQQEPTRHVFSKTEFFLALKSQLTPDPRNGAAPFARGRSSIVFRVVLLSHGYKFVGKGTIDELSHVLKGEHDVYTRLYRLQGNQIPVSLGMLELSVPYFYMADRICLMLLLSWAGVESEFESGEKSALLRALRSNGVIQNDFHDPNFCRDPGTKRVMAIDFEDVTFEDAPCHERIGSLKRKRKRSDRVPGAGKRYLKRKLESRTRRSKLATEQLEDFSEDALACSETSSNES